MPKKGPLLQWGRVLHFLIAVTITGYGGHLGGYGGSIWTGVVVIVGGFLWELSNKYLYALTKSKLHPFADAVDFWAVVIGAVFGGLGYVIVGG